MNELEQIEKKYAELGKEIERLKAKPSKKRERVGHGEFYWYVTRDGGVCEGFEDAYSTHAKRFAIGNYFYTKEETVKARDRQLAEQRIFDALREHEGNWMADWSDSYQHKYYVSCDHDDRKFYLGSCNSLQPTSDTRYYSTKEACQWVMDNMEDDLRIVWGIE